MLHVTSLALEGVCDIPRVSKLTFKDMYVLYAQQ